MADLDHKVINIAGTNGETIPVPIPVTVSGGSGGAVATMYSNNNVLATGISVKGSAGTTYGWVICNNASSARFVKFYNKATAPAVGTDTPVIRIELPPTSTGQYSISTGIAFTLGIGIGATQLVADSDTTAPNANDVIVNCFFT